MGDELAPGVDQVPVFAAFRRQGAVADDAVFRMGDDELVRVDVVGAEGGHPYPQVHDPPVLKFHCETVAHGLPVQFRFVSHE